MGYTAGMTIDADKHALFFDLETTLHRRAVRNSPEAVSALLADDFVEFDQSGRVYDRGEIIELLKADDSDGPVEVRDFVVRQLSPTIVLVTYSAVRDRMPVLRSSIWALHEGAWQLTFLQGTRPTGR
jgi:hypothetical protein